MTTSEWLIQFCIGLVIGLALLICLGTCSYPDVAFEQIESPQPIEMRD